MKQSYTIPDHSPAALAEAYETALFSLAFQKLEEEELQMMQQRIKVHAKPASHQARFAQRLNRKLRRERGRALFLHALPRVAQAAACLIAIVSIGAGVALAASQEVRSWAAGVLTGTLLEEQTLFFGEASYERIEDGTVIGDQLVLMESDGELLVRDATDAEPVRYVWRDQGSRRLCRLEAYSGEIYALYEIGYRNDSFFEEERDVGAVSSAWGSFDRIGLGRLRIAQDGTFTVEELTSFDGKSLFDPQGREGVNGGVSRIAAGGGKLYFTTVCDVGSGEFSFVGERIERLFACDLTTGELAELSSPLEGVASPGYRLFSDETVYVGVENPMRIFRIEADGSYTPMAEFAMGEGANSYAYRASADTFYYQLGAGIYAAEHFDIANARRVALSGGDGGRGLLIGENSYVIIQFDGVAEVFDFDDEPEGVIELKTNGILFMSDEYRAANPNVTLVADPAYSIDAYETYIPRVLAGETEADVLDLMNDQYLLLADAGYGAPIRDPEVCAYIDSMPGYLREFVTRDGEYIAMPYSIFVRSDVSINMTRWREMGFRDDDLPETWLDLLQFLAGFSHRSDLPEYYFVVDTEEESFAEQIAKWTVRGFARNWRARSLAPDFGGEEFSQALAALQEIDFNALRCERGAGAEYGPYEHQLMRFHGEREPQSNYQELEWCERTLTICPGDPRISESYMRFVAIDPKTRQMNAALGYLRWRSSSEDRWEQLHRDFGTPAEELADAYHSAEAIARFREETGDMYPSFWTEEEYQRMCAAFTAYARSEIDFAAFAAALNEIYAL